MLQSLGRGIQVFQHLKVRRAAEGSWSASPGNRAVILQLPGRGRAKDATKVLVRERIGRLVARALKAPLRFR